MPRIEKIFNRSDGSAVSLTVYLSMGSNHVHYNTSFKFKRPEDDGFACHGEESDCTPAEIQAAKLELWEKLKPTE